MVSNLVSNEMMTLARENMTVAEYESLMVSMEASSTSIDIHKKFLGSLVDRLMQFLDEKPTRDKIFLKAIADSHGDITKVEQIDISLQVLTLLEKSKDAEIKSKASMLRGLYNQIKAHKEGFMKVHALMKTGSVYESTMAHLVYCPYICDVRTFVAAVSLLLVKVHNPDVKHPYFGTSVLTLAEKSYKSYQDGTVKKAINGLTKKDKSTHEAIEIVGALLIGTLIAFITLCLSIRILVYYFYYTRMQLADYFEEQATFLNLHKSELNKDKAMNAKEKDSIADAQKKWADRFMTLAEMIQDDDIASAKRAKEVIKKTNKEVIPTTGMSVPNTGMDFF